MSLIKIDDIKRGQPDIYLVRRAQATLAFNREYKNLMKYYNRSAFINVATMLTEKYWPESIKSKRAVVNIVNELYVLWLILLPISFHHLGYWRPGWGSSIFMSWFRYHVHKHKRYFLGRLRFDYNDADIEEGFSDSKINDQEFQSLVQQYVQQCSGETARAVMARMIFGPFVHWRQGVKAAELAKTNDCGVHWWEDEILFLTTSPFNMENVTWTDLRSDHQDVVFWQVGIKNGLLNIQVSKKKEKAIKDEITKILKTDGLPAFKLHQVNASMKKYYHWARYIQTTRQAALTLEKWVWKRIAKSIIASNSALKNNYYNIKHQKWDVTLRQGRRSMLLEADVSEDQWLQIWTPRRG